jgi:hypothetical protein
LLATQTKVKKRWPLLKWLATKWSNLVWFKNWATSFQNLILTRVILVKKITNSLNCGSRLNAVLVKHVFCQSAKSWADFENINWNSNLKLFIFTKKMPTLKIWATQWGLFQKNGHLPISACQTAKISLKCCILFGLQPKPTCPWAYIFFK